MLGLLFSTMVCSVYGRIINDGPNNIMIQTSQASGAPKDMYIQATINGHYLTVVFTENLGNVTVEVSKVNGGETQVESTPTPNGVNFYIFETGSYIVTF